MSFSSFRVAACVLAVALTPTVTFAQEVLGTIKASLDGVERTWFLTSEGDESQSFGLSIAMANLQSFNLWGQASAETVQEMKDSLLLGFDVMTVGEQMIPVNFTLTYLEDGWKSGWRAGEDEHPVFSLTTLEKRDDSIFVEGNFAVVAGFDAPLTGPETDASRAMKIDGSFSVLLPPALLKKR